MDSAAAGWRLAGTTPWSLSDTSEQFFEDASKALVGLEINITDLSGKLFLSQQRTEADRRSVRDQLNPLNSHDAPSLPRVCAVRRPAQIKRGDHTDNQPLNFPRIVDLPFGILISTDGGNAALLGSDLLAQFSDPDDDAGEKLAAQSVIAC